MDIFQLKNQKEEIEKLINENKQDRQEEKIEELIKLVVDANSDEIKIGFYIRCIVNDILNIEKE